MKDDYRIRQEIESAKTKIKALEKQLETGDTDLTVLMTVKEATAVVSLLELLMDAEPATFMILPESNIVGISEVANEPLRGAIEAINAAAINQEVTLDYTAIPWLTLDAERWTVGYSDIE